MKSILLVDDSRMIRQLASTALREQGFDVIEAENGQCGLDIARERELDLILTDLNMPIMDGLGMAKQVRTLPKHSATPILLVTTESQLAKKQEAKRAGANGWVVKPIPPKRLVEVVNQVLAKQGTK